MAILNWVAELLYQSHGDSVLFVKNFDRIAVAAHQCFSTLHVCVQVLVLPNDKGWPDLLERDLLQHSVIEAFSVYHQDLQLHKTHDTQGSSSRNQDCDDRVALLGPLLIHLSVTPMQ
jgi:hypothetical protein